jgi:hypothetical protein
MHGKFPLQEPQKGTKAAELVSPGRAIGPGWILEPKIQ